MKVLQPIRWSTVGVDLRQRCSTNNLSVINCNEIKLGSFLLFQYREEGYAQYRIMSCFMCWCIFINAWNYRGSFKILSENEKFHVQKINNIEILIKPKIKVKQPYSSKRDQQIITEMKILRKVDLEASCPRTWTRVSIDRRATNVT